MLTASLPSPLRSPLLDTTASAGVKHGYFTRIGGVSEGLYSGLNTGTGSNDDPERVAENRRRVATGWVFRRRRCSSLHQVHSPDAIVVDGTYGLPRPNG